MQLSKLCEGINPSITLEIDAKAKKMKADGIDVIGFGAGEPDFDTPEFIKQAAVEALAKGMTKYTPAAGTLEIRKAICKKLADQNGLEYKPSEIVVSNGAKHSLFNAFAAILNPGDEVIIPSPYWVTYPEVVGFFGAKPLFVNTKESDGFVPNVSEIESLISKKTKAIVINSPCNPTGAVFSEEILRAIGDLAVKHDFCIISDEIYEELIYDGNTHKSIASLSPAYKERTILVNGFSKAYAMTGWRLGYTAAPAMFSDPMSSLQSHATSNPNSIAQYAGTAALLGPRDDLLAMVSQFDSRRKFMAARINSIEGISCALPKGAFYVMMNISKLFGKKCGETAIVDSMSFCDALLEKANVAVVPGIAFGCDDYCRLSYATGQKNIENGLDRIEAFIKALR